MPMNGRARSPPGVRGQTVGSVEEKSSVPEPKPRAVNLHAPGHQAAARGYASVERGLSVHG